MFSEKVIFAIIVLAITLIAANNAAKGDNNKQDAKCLLPMDPGSCHLNLERFYYNAKSDTCEKFKFHGCMGNDNRFGFKQTCEQACKKSITATTKATTPFNAEKLNLKFDTNVAAISSSTTTSKPVVARTTVKTLTSAVTAAAQKSKRV